MNKEEEQKSSSSQEDKDKEEKEYKEEEEEESDDDSDIDDAELDGLFSMLKNFTGENNEPMVNEFNALLKEKMEEVSEEDLNITILSLAQERKEFNSYKGKLINKILSSPHPYGKREDQKTFVLSIINKDKTSEKENVKENPLKSIGKDFLSKDKGIDSIFSLISSAFKNTDIPNDTAELD
jgi:hypothetical protein